MLSQFPNHEQIRKFNDTFHRTLIPDFFNRLTGFDIIKFDDEVLQSPDGKSCADVLLENYSQEAHDLIVSLLNL
jgi:hypothetical protein